MKREFDSNGRPVIHGKTVLVGVPPTPDLLQWYRNNNVYRYEIGKREHNGSKNVDVNELKKKGWVTFPFIKIPASQSVINYN